MLPVRTSVAAPQARVATGPAFIAVAFFGVGKINTACGIKRFDAQQHPGSDEDGAGASRCKGLQFFHYGRFITGRYAEIIFNTVRGSHRKAAQPRQVWIGCKMRLNPDILLGNQDHCVAGRPRIGFEIEFARPTPETEGKNVCLPVKQTGGNALYGFVIGCAGLQWKIGIHVRNTCVSGAARTVSVDRLVGFAHYGAHDSAPGVQAPAQAGHGGGFTHLHARCLIAQAHGNRQGPFRKGEQGNVDVRTARVHTYRYVGVFAQ